MLTVYYNDETGEDVQIKVNTCWLAEGAVMHADTLQDLLVILTTLYTHAAGNLPGGAPRATH
tara:strand:+ start:363 stop:548 length:186 start_codon:yes stop_codon:yes gene_type:complete